MRNLSIILLLALLSTSADAQNATTVDWSHKTPEEAGFSPKRFHKFLVHGFTRYLTFKTDAIIVIKDGHLVYEGYTNGYKRDQKHSLFSLGKTMLNGLAGVLEQQGLLHRQDQVSKYYPEINRFGAKDVTIEQLLNMSSGIEWIEEDRKNLLQSDSWFGLYSRESYKDMPAWVAQRPLLYPGPTKFNYSSGDAALLVAAFRGAIGEDDYLDYFWDNFFDKAGMTNVAIERDGAGNLALHGMGYSSGLDLARFGMLYLQDGVVNGEALWPADWVEFTRRMAPSQHNLPEPNDRNMQNDEGYGAQIWLNVKRAGVDTLPYPGLPENALLGIGSRGQFLLILPTEKVVLVRMADDSELFLNRRAFFNKFYSSIRGATK